jgi:Cys-tRNA(Pro)/Cys-tRNA(Cys) deacylase
MSRLKEPPLLSLRRLRQLGVDYELIEFDPAIRSAGEVALAAGHAPQEVFKTLVLELDVAGAKPVLAVAPASAELDLKRVAALLGAKRIRMALHRDAERLTGLRVGGISALALTEKGWRTLLDDSARTLDRILVSAGRRGFDVRLATPDFIAVTGAEFARLT